MSDITERIDEILAFAGAVVGGLKSKPSNTSSALRPELNRLLSIFLQNMRTMKDKKKAINKVIKQEDLNKNWEKKFRQYIKQNYK